jgi:CRISP-associated protein Cas1
VCVGAGAVRCYAGITADSQSTYWLERQVRAWSNDNERLRVATSMYERRFGETVRPGTTLAQLRGLEGQRMKALYKTLAETHHIRRFRRNYDRSTWDQQDPVNLALSAASTCLYGVTHATLLALGCSPALGFIHTGTQHAFVYDIADLYKARVTVPLAFSLHNSTMPERDVRRKLRDQFRLLKLLPRIIADVQNLLAPEDTVAEPEPEPEVDLVSLWDPVAGELPGGVNYGDGDF